MSRTISESTQSDNGSAYVGAELHSCCSSSKLRAVALPRGGGGGGAEVGSRRPLLAAHRPS